MKKIKVLLIFFTITCSIMAQENEITVPDGIIYHKVSHEINSKAKLNLIDCITSKNPDNLFDNAFICGPKLWQILNENNIANRIEGIKTIFHLSDKKVEGCTIQSKNGLNLIWDFLFQEVTYVGIRKLNSNELVQYWALISYDIEEPIYITEFNNLKLLIDLRDDNLKVVFLEIIE